MSAPSNALVGSIFFLAALISDALTAMDSAQRADVPASLRGTGLVLACVFAAPVLKSAEKGVSGVWQRPIAGALLFATAILGEHRGGSRTRAFDAAYTTVVGLSITWLFSAGGVDELSRESANGGKMNAAVSTSSAMLAAALLFYSNARILRAGLLHDSEVRNFLAQPPAEHAFASVTASVSVSTGATVGVASAIMMMRHAAEFSEGTRTVALRLGVAATVQLVCASAATMSWGEQVDHLPTLFGESACRSSSDACLFGVASRRFAAANTQATGLWLSALGMFALAYPVKTRFLTQIETREFAWDASVSIFGLAAMCVALLLVYANADFAGAGAHTDYAALFVISGASYAFFCDGIVGTALIVAAYATDEVLCAADVGAGELFSHLTHVALVLTIALLALHLLLQVVSLWHSPRHLQELTGTVAVAGLSIACALYCAACCLLLATNGSLGGWIVTHDGAHFAVAFALRHFAPVFCWAPLLTCRCEPQLLSRWQRLGAWLCAPPFVAVVYALVLVGLNRPSPSFMAIDWTSLGGCVLGVGLVPWLAASSV